MSKKLRSPLDARNQHLLPDDPVDRRIRLPRTLDAKLLYAADVHRLSPSELVAELLGQALAFDLPAVPYLRPPRISLPGPHAKHSA